MLPIILLIIGISCSIFALWLFWLRSTKVTVLGLKLIGLQPTDEFVIYQEVLPLGRVSRLSARFFPQQKQQLDQFLDRMAVVLNMSVLLVQKTVVDVISHFRRFDGKAYFPDRIYVGNSYTITVQFERGLDRLRRDSETPSLKVLDDKIELEVLASAAEHSELEIELYAPCANISRIKKPPQLLQQDVLEFEWICLFHTSDDHDIRMEIHLKESGEIKRTASLTRRIRVVKFDGLTERQAWVFNVAAGIIGFFADVGGIIGVLHDLGAF